MANRNSKRSRAGKEIASSSNPTPIYNYGDGSVLWFEHKKERQRFIQEFENRLVLPPRFTTPRFLGDYPHSNMLLQSSLLDFVYLKYDFINPLLIQAFYSNLKKDEDGILSTHVNGTHILLNEENIQAITNLPCDGEDIVNYTGVEGIPFEENVFFNLIGIGDFEFTPMHNRAPIKGIFPEFRLILYVVSRILKPRKSNHATIGREDATIMHAIISRASINWCKFILVHMFDSIGSNKPLPYALLIMHILEASQINTNVGTKITRTKYWEIQEKSFHGHDQVEQPRPPPPPPQTRRPQADISQAILDHIASLSTSVNRIDRNVSRLSDEIHGYFDHVQYPYSHVYSASTSSDEDDFDDDGSS